MKLYVGNMSVDVTEEELQNAFSPFGEVKSVTLINDKITGKSKGFGFVQMSSKEEGHAAIEAMHDKEFKGSTLTVNEAKPQTKRPHQGGFGGGKRGFGRGNENKGGFRGGKGGFGGGGRGQRNRGGRGR